MSKKEEILCGGCNKPKGKGDGFCNCGTPLLYDPKFPDMVDDYLATCGEKELEFHRTRGEKSDSYERYLKVNIPSVEGFASYLGFHKSSLYRWAKKYKRFGDALERISQEQFLQLQNGGIDGRYNPTIVKLFLSHNHGVRETQKHEVSGPDGGPIEVDNLSELSTEDLIKRLEAIRGKK